MIYPDSWYHLWYLVIASICWAGILGMILRTFSLSVCLFVYVISCSVDRSCFLDLAVCQWRLTTLKVLYYITFLSCHCIVLLLLVLAMSSSMLGSSKWQAHAKAHWLLNKYVVLIFLSNLVVLSYPIDDLSKCIKCHF